MTTVPAQPQPAGMMKTVPIQLQPGATMPNGPAAPPPYALAQQHPAYGYDQPGVIGGQNQVQMVIMRSLTDFLRSYNRPQCRFPADTRRNYIAIITSKRRHDVVMT